MSNKELASTTLQARFLPFVLDKNDPNFREIAIRCANECEAMGRAIREYAQFNNPIHPYIPANQAPYVENQSFDSNSQENLLDEEMEDELDPELDKRKKQRRDKDFGF